MFIISIPDVSKSVFIVLLTLIVPTIIFCIYTAPILDAIHYSVIINLLFLLCFFLS